MALEHSEIQAIKREILDETDKRYVHVDDCNENKSHVNRKLAEDDTRIRLFEQKMKSWEWLFKLIATGTIGTLLTSILSLVFK